MTNQKPQAWEDVADKMPKYLSALQSDTLRNRDKPCKLPEQGIYVFYENDKPIYVGRTNRMPKRILEHGSPTPTRAATFAYLVAKRELECRGITPEPKPGKPASRITNADVEKHPGVISAARKRISKMQFRVVEINDPIEQTIFEVYATLNLGTTRQQGGYNDFDNH